MQAPPKASVVHPPVQVALAHLRHRLLKPAGRLGVGLEAGQVAGFLGIERMEAEGLAQRLLHRRQGAGGGARFGGYLKPGQGYKTVLERASYAPCRLRC
jgi:hypothetical protein